MLQNLTQYETQALKKDFNLADAHTHQSPSPLEQEVIANLPHLFHEAGAQKQHELDAIAIRTYHELAGQRTANEWGGSYLCYSASMAMEVVANYLRLHSRSLGLIEPTFDNISDILKRHQIELSSIDDRALAVAGQIDWFHLLLPYAGEAIFLTLPNNPTGTFLQKEDFERLAKICKQLDILFVADMCFRLYEPDYLYDQYELLQRYDTNYIIMEDTGKVWPVLDLKFSILNCHPNLCTAIYHIHSDFLLNVSPFILRLLPEFFEVSKRDGFQSTRQLVHANRAYLRSKLPATFLDVAYPASRISVEFLRIHAAITANELVQYLSTLDIHVLPGDMFFWKRPELGSSYIRIALARDIEHFKTCVDRMVDAINGLSFDKIEHYQHRSLATYPAHSPSYAVS